LIYVWFFSWLKNVTMASLFFSMFHHEKHTCFTCAKCVGGTSASTTSVNRLWGSIRGDLGDLGGQLQRGQYWVARNFPTPLETSENISWNMLQTLEIWWNIMEYAQMLCFTHILHVPVVLKMCKHKNERTNSLVVNSIRAELMIVASMNLACSACTCSQFNQSLKTHPQTANRISRM
jgi:hypothetical protein